MSVAGGGVKMTESREGEVAGRVERMIATRQFSTTSRGAERLSDSREHVALPEWTHPVEVSGCLRPPPSVCFCLSSLAKGTFPRVLRFLQSSK